LIAEGKFTARRLGIIRAMKDDPIFATVKGAVDGVIVRQFFPTARRRNRIRAPAMSSPRWTAKP
jgi:hypothetical protein